MPLYDYVCESCGNTVEVIHSISATGPTTCAVCGGKMRRALSAPAIVFKGSGWAKKDARDASRAKAAKPVTAEGATSGAGAGASPEGTTGSTTSSDAPTDSATSGSAAATGTKSSGPTTTAKSGGTTGGSGATPS